MCYKKYLIPVVLIGIAVVFTGCKTALPSAQSNGEQESGFTYVPLDPFAVEIIPPTQASGQTAQDSVTNGMTSSFASVSNTNILQSLPDNAVRIATEQFDANGNVSYGPASASVGGSSYKITVDFISSDTVNLKVYVEAIAHYTTNGVDSYTQWTDPSTTPPKLNPPMGYYVTYNVVRIPDKLASSDDLVLKQYIDPVNYTNLNGSFYNIPIYIGIGLRVTADITTFQSGLNISGLGAIGSSAGVTNLTGTLVVQTLGVNGKSISAALPIQSELNQSTAQNAIVAVGAIKALLYEPDTVITPRVVGMYFPFSGSKSLVNAIITQISQGGVEWSMKSSK